MRHTNRRRSFFREKKVSKSALDEGQLEETGHARKEGVVGGKLVRASEAGPVLLEVVEVEQLEDAARVEREVDHGLAFLVAACLDERAVEHEEHGVDPGPDGATEGLGLVAGELVLNGSPVAQVGAELVGCARSHDKLEDGLGRWRAAGLAPQFSDALDDGLWDLLVGQAVGFEQRVQVVDGAVEPPAYSHDLPGQTLFDAACLARHKALKVVDVKLCVGALARAIVFDVHGRAAKNLVHVLQKQFVHFLF